MLNNEGQNTSANGFLSGTVASPGVAIARARVIKEQVVSISNNQISPAIADSELQRFFDAREKSIQQLSMLSEKARRELGDDEADVFEGFIVMLEDEELEEEVQQLIKHNLHNTEFSVNSVMQENIEQLQQLEDPYLRARADDMKDLQKRMLNNLQDELVTDENRLNENSIIVAENLSPAQTLLLDANYVQGFVTALGGGLSHTAILAKALGLPAIVNIQNDWRKIGEGDLLIIDADNNRIFINPDENTIENYQQRLQIQACKREKSESLLHQPAQTRDGHQFRLYANIGSDNDTDNAKKYGAQGIGLFRSEFLFMGKKSAPSEEEQFQAYRRAVEQMNGSPVILRTLDIGGDKDLPYLGLSEEENPFLGKRAIRLCFDQPELLITQLRAAMRASVYGKLKLMFPMIISVEEVRRLRAMLNSVIVDLENENIPLNKNIEIGAMIETPAAVIMAEQLIQELDFFSIGSNDLTQYILAVDRCNSEISHLYDPLTPAVVRAIKQVVDAAHVAGKWVGVCGEMAACSKASKVLVGLGVDELSVSAAAIPTVKLAICDYTLNELQELASQVVNVATRDEVETLLSNYD